MKNHRLEVQRLHCTDGDYDPLGYWSKGHWDEREFRGAVLAYGTHFEDYPEKLKFETGWWRVIPIGHGNTQFKAAAPGARGAFPVTFLSDERLEL